MFTFVAGHSRDLSPSLYARLTEYRYRVFVERMRWRLPQADHAARVETDEFDTGASVYLIALASDGDICGCARLLPTDRPYLLRDVFPTLADESPHSSVVWELSRFSAMRVFDKGEVQATCAGLGRAVFMQALREARLRGAERLVGVMSSSVERACRRFGADLVRMGVPMRWEGDTVVACSIATDAQLRQPMGARTVVCQEDEHIKTHAPSTLRIPRHPPMHARRTSLGERGAGRVRPPLPSARHDDIAAAQAE